MNRPSTKREFKSRFQRAAALGAIVIAAAASIATSKLDRAVHGFAVSMLFDLTAEHPVRTFDVTVDMNDEATVIPGGRRTVLIDPMFSSATGGGAEVTATLSFGGMQSTRVVLEGHQSGIATIEVAPADFATCQAGQPCVRQGTVRFELRSGASASGSFTVHAKIGGFTSDPPAGAAIKVMIAEQAP